MSEPTHLLEPLLAFGPFTIDRRSLELRRQGQLLRLQQQPARVLLLLVDRAGDLVTREELRRAIWSEDVVVDFDRGLNFCISQIRCVLAEDSNGGCRIETLRGRGYRFIGPARSSPMPGSHAFAPPAPARRWWLPPVIGAAVLITFGGLSLAPRHPSWQTRAGAVPVLGARTEGGVDSEKVAMYEGSASGSRLESRVDRREDRYRVTVTLREANGTVRWSDAFDGQPSDWIDAQREMSHTIAQALRPPLKGPSGGETKRHAAMNRYPVLRPRAEPYVQNPPTLRPADPSKVDTVGPGSALPPLSGIHGSATSM